MRTLRINKALNGYVMEWYTDEHSYKNIMQCASSMDELLRLIQEFDFEEHVRKENKSGIKEATQGEEITA